MNDFKKSEDQKTMYFQLKLAMMATMLDSEVKELILASAENRKIKIGKALSINEELQQKLEKAFNACPNKSFQIALALDIKELLKFHKTLTKEPYDLLDCAVAINGTLAIAHGSQVLEVFL